MTATKQGKGAAPSYRGEVITDKAIMRELVWGDGEGFGHVHSEITGQSRWMTHMETIVRRESDGKLFRLDWHKASTENSGEHEFPDEAYEVKAIPVTTFKYERV